MGDLEALLYFFMTLSVFGMNLTATTRTSTLQTARTDAILKG